MALEPAFPDLPRQERPIGLVHLPEHDRFLIVIQKGRILSVPGDGPYHEPGTVLDMVEETVCCAENGLLSIALAPDFSATGHLYVYYSPSDPKGITRLSRFTLAGEPEALAIEPESELVVFEVGQPYGNHNGGTVVFGPDGMLYLGIGDGGSGDDPHGHGQNRSTYLSTIIRIDVRNASRAQPYTIPDDNPLLGEAGTLPEVWAYGLRNPWRMSFDRETGLLWAGDVGQRRVEEVNVISAGANYGWNTMEGSLCFEPPDGCDRTDLALPVWEYSHAYGCAITGGYVYRGEAIPGLRGWYLYSDFCNGLIWGIEAETAASGGYVEPVLLWAGGPNRVVSFAEDAAGELYVVSFGAERIYRIVAPGQGGTE